MDRKKLKCLTLKEKADCLKEIRSGVSVTALANKYNVAKSTICGIKKKEQQILKCVNNTFSGPGKRQTLKTSELPKMEKALYSWFLSQRNKNYPINGLILKQKAKELHSKLKENNSNFFPVTAGFKDSRSATAFAYLLYQGKNYLHGLSWWSLLRNYSKIKLRKWV